MSTWYSESTYGMIYYLDLLWMFTNTTFIENSNKIDFFMINKLLKNLDEWKFYILSFKLLLLNVKNHELSEFFPHVSQLYLSMKCESMDETNNENAWLIIHTHESL